MTQNLLRALATKRPATDPVVARYDPSSQTSLVLDGDAWVPSWESTSISQTKKCDHETGEDQKGH